MRRLQRVVAGPHLQVHALLEAAQMLAKQPEAMQLRYLQTMTQVAGDRATTIVFPLPMDLVGALLSKNKPAVKDE